MAERNIDGVTYSCAPILATRAIVLQAKLMKVVGPALPALIQAFSAGDEAARAGAGVAALEAVSQSVEPESFGALVKEVVELAEVQDGGRYRRVIMDQDFTGNLAGIIPVASFVLETQFADFFSGLRKTGARRTAATA